MNAPTPRSASPLPPHIRHVAVVGPASPGEPEKVRQAVATAEGWGLKVTVTPSALAPVTDPGGRSADPQLRLDDLHDTLADPSVDLLWCVRGGYGSAQLLGHLDWARFAARTIPLLGYSDITALLLAMHAHHVGIPVAAPSFCELPHLLTDDWSRTALAHALDPAAAPQRICPPPRERPLLALRDGSAQGPLFPVTLTLICSLLGTPHLPDLRGAILLVEDVNEPVYKLDRMLTQLLQAGLLAACAGLLLGGFRRCGNATARQALLAKFAAAIPGPVVADVPFGHRFPRLAARLGQTLRILPGPELWL